MAQYSLTVQNRGLKQHQFWHELAEMSCQRGDNFFPRFLCVSVFYLSLPITESQKLYTRNNGRLIGEMFVTLLVDVICVLFWWLTLGFMCMTGIYFGARELMCFMSGFDITRRIFVRVFSVYGLLSSRLLCLSSGYSDKDKWRCCEENFWSGIETHT